MDHGPVAVFVTDDQRRYLAVNAYACELLGYTREELLDLHPADVTAHGQAQEGFRTLDLHRELAGRVELRRKDGSLVPASYRSSETTVSGMRFWVGVCMVDEGHG